MRIACPQKQPGAALIIFAFILALTATAFSLSLFSGRDLRSERDRRTDAALAEAKAALIGWSASNSTMPGALPCPDITNSGSSGSCAANSTIGRLPWKTLGINALRDGQDECLWYALSPVFRNNIPVTSRGGSQPALNSMTVGSITLLNDQGIAFPAPINPVIAVIISPGSALEGQSRDPAGLTSTCGGNNLAVNYLDSANGINNSSGNYISGNNYTFTLSKNSITFNDRLIYITAEDLFMPLRKRIGAEIYGTSQPTYGLTWYYNKVTNHSYPWAADMSGTQQTTLTAGYLPHLDLNLTVSSLNQWLTNNAWFSLLRYQVGADFQPGTSYPQQCGSNCLIVRGQQTQAAVMIVEGGVTKWATRVCSTNPLVTNCPLL